MLYQVLLLTLAIAVTDQLTKLWAVRSLQGSFSVPVLPGIFHLTLVRNPGVAFGLFSGYSLPVSLATTLIVVCLLWSVLREKPEPLMTLGIGLILGGAVGNLIDRVRVGGVIDFLDFRVWPIFNLADSCITTGAALIALTLLRSRKAS